MEDRYLYKAKRTDNGEWVEGYLGRPHYTDTEKGVESNWFYARDERGWYAECIVDTSTICQCTGLKDKTGKLIWENDVVIRKLFGKRVVGVVVWFDMGFTGFMLKVKNDGKVSFYPMGKGQYDDDENDKCNDEVIGSAIDNPELLEVGE